MTWPVDMFADIVTPRWRLSHGGDAAALQIVDGTGPFARFGPHYSRRSPGASTFTGCGFEVVLVTEDDCAVWAAVLQRVPVPRGKGSSRGRGGEPYETRRVWRNMMFRNLGAGLSSLLIEDATAQTYRHWLAKYGDLPPERLRTEVDRAKIASSNPGYCYLRAGWIHDRWVGTKRYLLAPERT